MPDPHVMRDVTALEEQAKQTAQHAEILRGSGENPEVNLALHSLAAAVVLIAGAHRMLERADDS